MPDRLTLQNLRDAQRLLIELFQVVSRQESTLSGSTQLGPATEALRSLLDTRVEFGKPESNLIPLSHKLIENMGVKLTVPQQYQIDNNMFKFYYTVVPVSIRIAGGAKFTQLVCNLEFGPKGADEPIVQNIFPTSHLKESLSGGASMNIAVKGDVEAKAKFTLPQTL